MDLCSWLANFPSGKICQYFSKTNTKSFPEQHWATERISGVLFFWAFTEFMFFLWWEALASNWLVCSWCFFAKDGEPSRSSSKCLVQPWQVKDPENGFALFVKAGVIQHQGCSWQSSAQMHFCFRMSMQLSWPCSMVRNANTQMLVLIITEFVLQQTLNWVALRTISGKWPCYFRAMLWNNFGVKTRDSGVFCQMGVLTLWVHTTLCVAH